MENTDNAASVISKMLVYIRAHRFEPGERLASERTLAEKFGVGRGAVREALAILEYMRVVERRPNSGVYLRDTAAEGSLEALVLQNNLGLALTEKDVREAMEVRYLLEIQALPMACTRRTEEDLDHMRAILKESDECIRAGRGIERQDWDFHIAMVAAAKNDIFVRVVNTFYFLSWARRQVYFSDIKRSRHSNTQHKKIFRAIEAQDVSGAIALMQQHLGQVERDWQTELTKQKVQPDAAPERKPAASPAVREIRR